MSSHCTPDTVFFANISIKLGGKSLTVPSAGIPVVICKCFCATVHHIVALSPSPPSPCCELLRGSVSSSSLYP